MMMAYFGLFEMRQWIITVFLIMLVPHSNCVRNSALSVRDSLKSSTTNVGDTNFPAPFAKLRWSARDCVEESYAQFARDNIGRDKEGSWVVQTKFALVQEAVEDLKLDEKSSIFSLIEKAPWPMWLNLTDSFQGSQSTGYEFSLFSIPAGQSLQPRRHPAGTIVLFKKLFGSCQMRTLINVREINKLELQDDVLVRLAGTTKVFESLEGGTAVVFELAVFPPRRVDEGFGTDSGFSSESKELTCRMDVSCEDANGMFVSASEAMEEERRQLEEGERRNRGGVDRSYDVLAQMQNKVGGLGSELQALARRILISRQLPAEVLGDLGLTHVKGLLLHGPPGCGKTLIARELARALNTKDPIVVNGPEMLSKYIGEAEGNIRNLFKGAELEWKEKGLASSLHVIIFDEFDSIGRTRGSSRDASGVRDSCVNQLLTLLDGTRQMSNVLVIALTNRKDMVDPALLRPGRLEVHIEIGLPTEEGRKEILNILFAPLLSGKYVSESDGSVWTDKIARLSQGASGADLSGIMRNAASHAIERWQAEHRYREGMLRLTVEKNTVGLISQGQAEGQGLRKEQGWGSALYIDGRDPLSNLQYVWKDFESAVMSLNS